MYSCVLHIVAKGPVSSCVLYMVAKGPVSRCVLHIVASRCVEREMQLEWLGFDCAG